MMPVAMGPMMLAWMRRWEILLESQRKVKNEMRVKIDTTWRRLVHQNRDTGDRIGEHGTDGESVGEGRDR